MPKLTDLNDFVNDLNGVVEDQLVSFGFTREVAKTMVFNMSSCWYIQMKENMDD